MTRILIISSLFCFHFTSNVQAQKMNYERMDKILQTECDSVAGGGGAWQLLYRGRLMMLIADDSHNRMRIITPIAGQDELEPEHLENALIANFHSALDVKYALSEGILWSAYIHPLAELTKEQLHDALSQVYLSAETFGTTYQSTELVFPIQGQPKEKPKENKSKNKKL